MNFKAHAQIGTLASVAVTGAYSLHTQNIETLGLVFALCLAGSLAPDLDCQSKPSKFTCLVGSIFCAWSIVKQEPYPALIAASILLFIKSLNHRTWTHTYTVPLILTVLALKNPDWWFLIPFTVGIVVHLIVDCFGPQKVYPWKLRSWIHPIKIL